MNTQDMIAIATFAIAIMGVVYAFGQRDNRLSELEKDVNSLDEKLSRSSNCFEEQHRQFNSRLERLSEFYVRVDQRVLQLQEECFGEEKTDRLRETPSVGHYTTINEPWYSENSGIDL